ncbi:divalent metal cation transporter [Leptobacterium flavescens]|uniref:Divalent metal cation transporter n=1 Tax=Leptobacterium flavescens TaxID=472055 RepID=A0A6P0UPS4_9FLAO|nr:Nramp family divalent metal transporter [Leptobacterium flavescens]NER12376.1 divalent metal cation transporter [Leptobacterium flavescens]
MSNLLKKLGPGLLFAGAAIGVSHLVQSTRAGADFGFGLIWALLLVNLFKYPFFQYGPRYAMATGESLLDGYKKMGKWVIIAYFILTFATMFAIQTAVTIVTAGLAVNLFGITDNVVVWSTIITFVCLFILLVGKYKLLDNLIKFIIIALTISTITAVIIAAFNSDAAYSFKQVLPEGAIEVSFLIAFMGWMPAPLDISVWHSLWAIEKKKTVKNYDIKSSLLDFNIGYIGTIILGVCFVSLGALVMFNSGETFSNSASAFSGQLISLYTSNLGEGTYIFIALAAFTTMFSTTITTLDASPRAMAHISKLLFGKLVKHSFIFWMMVLVFGTIAIFVFFLSEMKLLVDIATILSFITAPFYAIINYKLITSKHTPKEWRPGLLLKTISILGILFLLVFSIWYITTL